MALDGSAPSVSPVLTQKPDSVRLAVPEDEERLYKFLTLLHSENGMGPLERHSAMGVIQKGTRKQGGIIGIIELDGKIVASVGLKLNSLWYCSTKWWLDDLWTFVHPDHRCDHHFEKLIQFAKWAADSMKVPVIFSLVTLHRLHPKTRLYRQHLPQVGSIFMYVPPGDEDG